MLKEKNLTKLRQTRFKDGNHVNLHIIQQQLQETADSDGIPVLLEWDKLQSGGMLSKTHSDCLILCHPTHADAYSYYVFTISREGKYAFVDVFTGGISKAGALVQAKQSISSGGFSSLDTYGKGLVIGTLVGNAVSGTIFHNSNKKYESEQNWHLMIQDLLNDVFGEA